MLSGDILLVEVFEHAETHHRAVKLHPAVHLAPADIAHHMVDILETDGTRNQVLGADCCEARQEGAVIVIPLDKGVDGVAIGGKGAMGAFAWALGKGSC